MTVVLVKTAASSVGPSREPASVCALKKTAEKISKFSYIYKGLNYFFNWLGYLPLSQRELSRFNRSQAQMKITQSTFVFPALIKNLSSFISEGGSLISALKSSMNIKKKEAVGCAAKTCRAGIKSISGCCKVFTCLDKTKILDLAKISANASNGLSNVSAVTHFLSSVISMGMAGEGLYTAYRAPRTATDIPALAQNENRKKICLLLKVAAAVTSLASATFAILTIVSGGAFSPLLLLSLSTVAFALTLLHKFSKEDVSEHKKQLHTALLPSPAY